MATESVSKLGAHLKALREKRGLSLAQVGEEVGLSPSYIFYLESGQRQKPHPDNLYRLARFYGVLAEDLLALAGYTPADELPELGAYLRSKYGLSPEVVREIENYTEYLTERSDEPG
jgi:transcriptional regulator with XRE-family HTH domain